MDGDPVTGEPSESKASQLTLGEIFTTLCPSYMAIGMTYDEFWNRNTKVHKAYRDAWEIKQRDRNTGMWRQGMYIYDALLKVSPAFRPFGKGKIEVGDYPTEPYPMTKEEAQEREERERINRLKQFAMALKAEAKEAKGDG